MSELTPREWLGLEATHNPHRWYLPVIPRLSVREIFLFGGGRSEAGPTEQEDLPNAQPGDDGQIPPMRIVGCLEAEPLARCEFAHRRLVRISVAARAGWVNGPKWVSPSQVTRRADSMPSATIGAIVAGGAPSVDAITVMSASMPPRRP